MSSRTSTTAKLIIVAGQNPGTNHPRMLSALEIAKRQRREDRRRSTRCGRPAWSTSRTRRRPEGVVGHGTELADLHLPIKINGDLALFQALGSLLVRVGRAGPRLHRHATPRIRGVARRTSAALDWDMVTEVTGLSREQITGLAQLLRDSDRTVFCWAMGLTQHRNAVATIKEICNLALRPGQHRQARRRAVPGARALQRAGRPDDGDLGAAAAQLPGRAAGRVRLRPAAASTGWTPSIRSARCGTARRTSSSVWAATSSRPRRTPR